MIVASSLPVGKADSLVKLAEDLTGFVRQAVKDGASVLEIGRPAVDLFMEAQGDGDLGTSVLTGSGNSASLPDPPEAESR